MIAKSEPERRRQERRNAVDRGFWRALKGERRVRDRRRALYGNKPPGPASNDSMPPAATESAHSPSRDDPGLATGTAKAQPNAQTATDSSPDEVIKAALDAPPDVGLGADGTPITINLDADEPLLPGLARETAAPASGDPVTHATDRTDHRPVAHQSGALRSGAHRSADRRSVGQSGEPGTGAREADSAAIDPQRLAALRAMLKASEERFDRASRTRRPVLAKGTRVRVIKGDFAGHVGEILDADYIKSRVLLQLDGRERPCWVAFTRLGPA